jgi:hypothetical protein
METAAVQAFGSKIRNRSDLENRSALCGMRSDGPDAGQPANAAFRPTAGHAHPTEVR